MKVFTTSSGYRFNLFEPGDICRVVALEFHKSFLKPGTIVEVKSHPETMSREVMIVDRATGVKDQVNISQLELAEPALTYDATIDLGVVGDVIGDGITGS